MQPFDRMRAIERGIGVEREPRQLITPKLCLMFNSQRHSREPVEIDYGAGCGNFR